MHLRLPPELWHWIFRDVDIDALFNVSLACRDFHRIAKPFIFDSLMLRITRDSLGQPQTRDSARLDFYASDAIAPFVRYFTLLYLSKETTSPIFDVFHRFINMRQMFVVGVDFTRSSFQQIATLPSLRLLCLQCCGPPPDIDSLPLLRTHTFIYVHWFKGGDGYQSVHRWIALLNPNHLEHLNIPLTPSICSFFLAIDTPNPFPSLRTVILFLTEGALPHVPMILCKTPALRSLKLYRPDDDIQHQDGFTSTTSYSAPHLELYNGPHELLHVIPGRTERPLAPLRKLWLDCIAREGDSLDAFMDTLTICRPHLRDLTHLHMFMLKSMEFKSLAVLEEMCPVLQELHMYAETQDPIYKFTYDVLLNDLHVLPLPSALVSLSIQWTSRGDVPDFAAAKDSFLDRLPSLRRLWICDRSHLALLWSRKMSGEDHCTVFKLGSQDLYSVAFQHRRAVFTQDPELLDA